MDHKPAAAQDYQQRAGLQETPGDDPEAQRGRLRALPAEMTSPASCQAGPFFIPHALPDHWLAPIRVFASRSNALVISSWFVCGSLALTRYPLEMILERIQARIAGLCTKFDRFLIVLRGRLQLAGTLIAFAEAVVDIC
jgi:hypothetical protein